MCDEVRSAGYAELPDGPRSTGESQEPSRLTVKLSVRCDLPRELLRRGGTGSDEHACSRGGPDSWRSAAPPTRPQPPHDADNERDAEQ